MEQVLSIAQNITTLLMPVILLLGFVILFLLIRLLITVNKTAGAVKETTFLVNSMVHNSFFTVTNFLSGLFEKKSK